MMRLIEKGRAWALPGPMVLLPISTYDPGWHSLRLAWVKQFGVYMPLVTLDR